MQQMRPEPRRAHPQRQMGTFSAGIGMPGRSGAVIVRDRLEAQEEVVGVIFVTWVQNIPGGDLQGIVPGACHRAAGSHLVAAGGPALSRCVLLKRGSYATTALLRIDAEGLDVAFPERFATVHYRCLPSSAPITWIR